MKYVLFGTGDYYKRFISWFNDKEVVAILDNDTAKQETVIDGHPVLPPDAVSDLSYDAVVVLSFYIKEIRKQLLDLGVHSDKIFHFYDLHELFLKEGYIDSGEGKSTKSVLLLSHDLTLGGPALALYHAALALKSEGYEVMFASMLDGELRKKLEESFVPVTVDRRLQIFTMKELTWTNRYDLIVCNTINFNTFLSDRNVKIPVIWWLHDSSFFYDGVKAERLRNIDITNMKIVSVGPIPRNAMKKYRTDVDISDLIYGVSRDV